MDSIRVEGNFERYWKHLGARQKACVVSRRKLRWYYADGLNDVEQLCVERLGGCARILDIGAGDNRLKRKFVQAGFVGRYETLDVSKEFEHDYYSLDQVVGSYDAIILLEVIEHMTLASFYELMEKVEELLKPSGRLVISTPNPACIYPMWAMDMTHIQQYPMEDLVAFLSLREFECEAYRIILTSRRMSLTMRFRLLLRKIVTTQILGVDYATNYLVLARRCKRSTAEARAE